MLGRALHEHVLIRGNIIVPKLALFVIALADLPMAHRIVQPCLEARELLVGRNVKEELDDERVVGPQLPLEIVDQIIALRPNLFGHDLVHPRNQHVFIMGAVENYHLAVSGSLTMNAPEEIVSQLLRGRLLEADYRTSLRVHPIDHVTADAVLAGGVDSLEHDQYGSLMLGVQLV